MCLLVCVSALHILISDSKVLSVTELHATGGLSSLETQFLLLDTIASCGDKEMSILLIIFVCRDLSHCRQVLTDTLCLVSVGTGDWLE